MRIRLVVAQQTFEFRDPAKARAAIDGFEASRKRYQKSMEHAALVVAKLTEALDKGLAEDAAKAEAKKAAKNAEPKS